MVTTLMRMPTSDRNTPVPGIPMRMPVMCFLPAAFSQVADRRTLQSSLSSMLPQVQGFPEQRVRQEYRANGNPDKKSAIQAGTSHFKSLNKSPLNHQTEGNEYVIADEIATVHFSRHRKTSRSEKLAHRNPNGGKSLRRFIPLTVMTLRSLPGSEYAGRTNHSLKQLCSVTRVAECCPAESVADSQDMFQKHHD